MILPSMRRSQRPFAHIFLSLLQQRLGKGMGMGMALFCCSISWQKRWIFFFVCCGIFRQEFTPSQIPDPIACPFVSSDLGGFWEEIFHRCAPMGNSYYCTDYTRYKRTGQESDARTIRWDINQTTDCRNIEPRWRWVEKWESRSRLWGHCPVWRAATFWEGRDGSRQPRRQCGPARCSRLTTISGIQHTSSGRADCLLSNPVRKAKRGRTPESPAKW